MAIGGKWIRKERSHRDSRKVGRRAALVRTAYMLGGSRRKLQRMEELSLHFHIGIFFRSFQGFLGL